eukprot:m51a1_g10740 putative adenylate cyclase (639) ;mRNA; f:316691-327622
MDRPAPCGSPPACAEPAERASEGPSAPQQTSAAAAQAGATDPQLRISRLTQRFVCAEVEDAYRRHYDGIYATTRSVAHFCALIFLVMALLTVTTAAVTRGRYCHARMFMLPAAAVALLAVAFLAGVVAVGGLATLSQEALTVVCSLVLIVPTALVQPLCRVPSADEYTLDTVAVEYFGVVATWFVQTIYVFFGATVWPTSLVASVVSIAPVWAVTARLTTVNSLYYHLLIFAVAGWLFVTLYAMMANWERRKQFAESLLLERERRQGAVEKSATNSLVSALFPKGVSEQVIEALASRAEASESASVSTTCSKSNNKQNTSIRTESFAKRAPLLANSYATCAIVTATVGNVDRAGPPAAQLEALSRFFIASDAVAASVGAEKIKTVGTSVMFAVGVPTVVELLNALFTRFDQMAAFHGLSPLRTDADEYIVVANMAGDTEDHASRAVRLAVDMVAGMRDWNTGEGQTKTPIRIRCAVHTDAFVSGVIKTKSCLFDCWGSAVPTAEAIAESCAPNSILVSRATVVALPDVSEVSLLPHTPVAVGDGAVEVYVLQGTITCSPSESPTLESSLFVPLGGVDYGVFSGTANPVDTVFDVPSDLPRMGGMSSLSFAPPFSSANIQSAGPLTQFFDVSNAQPARV